MLIRSGTPERPFRSWIDRSGAGSELYRPFGSPFSLSHAAIVVHDLLLSCMREKQVLRFCAQLRLGRSCGFGVSVFGDTCESD
jgi:hypothetical protein